MHGLLGLAACIAAAAHGQAMNVRGKVMDVAASAIRHATGALPGRMSLERGALELSVAQASPARIEIFGTKGHLLDRMASGNASAGIYRLHLAGRIQSKNLLIVKASIGRETRAFP